MKKLLLVLHWFVITVLVYALIPLLLAVSVLETIVSGSWLKRILLIALVLIVIAAAVGYYQVNRELGDPQKEYIVLLHPGDNAGKLFSRLVEVGFPANRLLYSLYMRRTGSIANSSREGIISRVD